MPAITEAALQELEAARITVDTFPSGWAVLTMNSDHRSNNKKTAGPWIDLECDPEKER